MEEEPAKPAAKKVDWKMISILAAVLVLIFAGFWLYIKRTTTVAPRVEVSETTPAVEEMPEASEPAIVESVEPTESAKATESVKPTTAPKQTDAELIKQAVLGRVGLTKDEAEVTITTNTGTHAKGNIKEVGAVGGGYWLAAKSGTEWIAVYDGQAQPLCDEIEPYAFPKTMVPECLDGNGEVVTR